MRPKPINPHVACRFCELEKHLRELRAANGGAILLKDALVAKAVLIVAMSFSTTTKVQEMELC